MTDRNAALIPQILDTIDMLRAEHHACTGRRVADHLRMSESWLRNVIHEMAGRGMVAFSPDMPGSLRTIRGQAVAIGVVEPNASPRPTIVADDAGVLELTWPVECGDETLVPRVLIAALVDASNDNARARAASDARAAAATADLAEHRARLAQGLVDTSGKLTGKAKAQKAAETRAAREPTPKELAHRQKLRDMAAAKRGTGSGPSRRKPAEHAADGDAG